MVVISMKLGFHQGNTAEPVSYIYEECDEIVSLSVQHRLLEKSILQVRNIDLLI